MKREDETISKNQSLGDIYEDDWGFVQGVAYREALGRLSRPETIVKKMRFIREVRNRWIAHMHKVREGKMEGLKGT